MTEKTEKTAQLGDNNDPAFEEERKFVLQDLRLQSGSSKRANSLGNGFQKVQLLFLRGKYSLFLLKDSSERCER